MTRKRTPVKAVPEVEEEQPEPAVQVDEPPPDAPRIVAISAPDPGTECGVCGKPATARIIWSTDRPPDPVCPEHANEAAALAPNILTEPPPAPSTPAAV